MSFICAGCVFNPRKGCHHVLLYADDPVFYALWFLYVHHIFRETLVVSWVFIPGYSVCFFPLLYLQGVHSGEFIILMHHVYKHYKHLKPPLLFFCSIPHGCNLCALRAQSDFSRRSKSRIEKSKIKVSGGPPPPPPPTMKRMAV